MVGGGVDVELETSFDLWGWRGMEREKNVGKDMGD